MPATNVAALITCHECDLLQREVRAAPGARVRCARCKAPLFRVPRPGDIEQAIALLAGALVLFAIANIFPVLTLELQGNLTRASVLDAVHVLWGREPVVATLVLLTGFLLPTNGNLVAFARPRSSILDLGAQRPTANGEPHRASQIASGRQG